ncbi:V-type ATP synthase subunit I [Nodosilinea nodulosa]|uniref:V-type ATP synthase subunit I n=1 Tax=Nodosilinea nodulosa TaxID=416001 RepID=UPI0002DBCCF7|nr:V-type ATPase 116kDa subunit family protein [Nodosilinea nodulosa]
MTIAKLKRLTVVGTLAEKSAVLTQLQALGVLHLIDLKTEAAPLIGDPFKDTRLALKYLEDCPQKQRPARHLKHFNPQQQVERVLKLKADIERLIDERDRISTQIDALKPWGNFRLPEEDSLDGLRFYFYQLTLKQFRQLAAMDCVYQLIKRDHRFYYVAVLHSDLPDWPIQPLKLPTVPLADLQEQLQDAEDGIENLETRRIGATRFIQALRDYLLDAQNASELGQANAMTHDEAGIFALQGWCPVDQTEVVAQLGDRLGLALEIQDPAPDDNPPVFLENSSTFAPGESLIQIYGMPGYRTWDPSAMVFVSFVLFFGLIIADAGYGVILLVLALLFRGRLVRSGKKQFWQLWLALSLSACIYGMLMGEYFGFEPPATSLLEKIAILQPNLEKLNELMAFSIGIGVVHVAIANLISMVHRWPGHAFYVHLGWLLVVVGGYAAWIFGFLAPAPLLSHLGIWGLGAGLVLVFCFSHPGPLNAKGLSQWFFGGLHGLTEASKIFGDVLSYLRLFALGLSSTYLALTFNQLSQDAASFGELGILLSFVILLFGHLMNFVLCIMAGTIHGLRLNFIEFYRWSQDANEEGQLFKPFQKYLPGR